MIAKFRFDKELQTHLPDFVMEVVQNIYNDGAEIIESIIKNPHWEEVLQNIGEALFFLSAFKDEIQDAIVDLVSAFFAKRAINPLDYIGILFLITQVKAGFAAEEPDSSGRVIN